MRMRRGRNHSHLDFHHANGTDVDLLTLDGISPCRYRRMTPTFLPQFGNYIGIENKGPNTLPTNDQGKPPQRSAIQLLLLIRSKG